MLFPLVLKSNREAMITQEELKSLLYYDQESGIFTRLTSPSGVVKIGDKAGFKTALGYQKIQLKGKEYLSHRLAWLYFYGEYPKGALDHINGDKMDNRISNLRLSSASQNGCNRKKPKNNTSGYKGVSLCKRSGKWIATIKINQKSIYLGKFSDILDAAKSYEEAAKKYHGEFYCI